MQRSFGLQIFDLEPIQSGVEQELTLKEAKKIVGGSGNAGKKQFKATIKFMDCIIDPIEEVPDPPGGGCSSEI